MNLAITGFSGRNLTEIKLQQRKKTPKNKKTKLPGDWIVCMLFISAFHLKSATHACNFLEAQTFLRQECCVGIFFLMASLNRSAPGTLERWRTIPLDKHSASRCLCMSGLCSVTCWSCVYLSLTSVKVWWNWDYGMPSPNQEGVGFYSLLSFRFWWTRIRKGKL